VEIDAGELLVVLALLFGIAVGAMVTGMCVAAARADREPRD
jgi:uncharacterized protein YneF (UPF0154 family)